VTEPAGPTANMKAPLAPLAGALPPRPAWFDAALARAPERRRVEVMGAGIEVLVWGEPGKPGLLLLHGNRAHADWWSFIAPFFADTHRVVAMSWSGMGGSDWRDTYAMATLVEEMDTVAQAAGLYDAPVKPVAVAHSFGAFVALRFAADRGHRFAGVVTVDMPMTRREGGARERTNEMRDNAVYADVPAALARYRFAPLQPCENLYIADHLARLSLKAMPEGEGVTWRFDPYFWRDLRLGSPAQDMVSSQCPVAVMWGGESVLIDKAHVERVRARYPAPMPWVEVPAAGHHVLVDQPLALVSALRGLLAAWPRARRPAVAAAPQAAGVLSPP
jgi:pimeloyl-ACP methyl ester carboxylesterase